MMMYWLMVTSGVVASAAFMQSIPHQHTSFDIRNSLHKPLHVSKYSYKDTHFSCNRQTKILYSTSADKSSDSDIITDEDNNDANNNNVVKGVTLKMAFDSSPVWGVADLSETKSERFTSPESLDMVHRLRRESDAVLVGRGTVERDDCSLTVRRVELKDEKSQPVRVVVDPSLRITTNEKENDYTLLKDELPTIVYHLQSENSKSTPSEHITLVGMKQSSYADGSRSSISPTQVITDLKRRGLQHVMVEGGPATARSFLEARAVDRAILVRAPIVFEIPVPAEMDENTLKGAGLQLIGTTTMGDDTVEYYTKDGEPWPSDDELSMWP